MEVNDDNWRAVMAVQAEEAARLRAAMRDIAEGRGRCDICGKPADGDGGGVVDCDGPYRCRWESVDPSWIAAKAMAGVYWADEWK